MSVGDFRIAGARLNRREFLAVTGLGAASLAVGGCPGPASSAGRPNIIFIMADDLGHADLGCYGQRLIKTPNIDALAEQGTLFSSCYAGSSLCAPSRCVLMSGLHSGHGRIRQNFPRVGGVIEAFGEGEMRLSLEAADTTVAEILKAAGYATGITGKWGLGEPQSAGEPNLQGFDEWLGYLNQNHACYHYTDYLWYNRTQVALEGNRDGGRKQYTHDMFTGFALDFIKRHRQGPFFLYLPWALPHSRFEVPSLEPYQDMPPTRLLQHTCTFKHLK